MTSEVARYEPPSGAAVELASRSPADEWLLAVAEVAKLARYISDTEFVPEAMRGRPAAVAAAMLAGREMQLAPMTSLQHIHVIKGKPGKSAEIMRAKVLEAGHSIRTIEANDTRVVLEGRRKGEEDWTRVAFTADQARRARIDLGGYPEDKLYARATTRLCRRLFADVITGIAHTIDELEDGVVDVDEPTRPVTATATRAEPKRTAQRRTPVRKPPAVTAGDLPANVSATPPPPPLPHEQPPPTPDPTPEPEPAPAPDPVREAVNTLVEEGLATEDEAQRSFDTPVTDAQLRKLHAFFTEHGISDRDEKLRIARAITGCQELASSTHLTVREASVLIDTLEKVAASAPDDVPRALEALFLHLEDEQET